LIGKKGLFKRIAISARASGKVEKVGGKEQFFRHEGGEHSRQRESVKNKKLMFIPTGGTTGGKEGKIA